MGENERPRATATEVLAEGESSRCTRQGVGRQGKPDEESELAGRGDSYGKPCDRDGAHPVAERRDAEARQESPCASISEQHPIRLWDHSHWKPSGSLRAPVLLLRDSMGVMSVTLDRTCATTLLDS